jgi:predicted outer membrane repeat protein
MLIFTLRNGVQLYGGFVGTETLLNQRNFTNNPTILSGNIGTPAVSDNSFHILYGSGLDSTTVLDGFTITQGNANGSGMPVSNGWGGGLFLEYGQGISNTCPVIQNCRFEQNSARSGGAIYCRYNQFDLVNPILRNCVFDSNRASIFAGAVYKSGPSLSDMPFIVENCRFSNNAALTSDGGGFFLANTGNTILFINCQFEKDSAATSWGGGIFCSGFGNNIDEISIVLDSCLFDSNYASESAGFCYTDFSSLNKKFSFEAKNCIFKNNKTRNSDAPAFGILSASNSYIDINVINTLFAGNLSFTNASALIRGDANSRLSASFENSIFLSNENVEGPDMISFPIVAGVGNGGSVSEVTAKNCLFANNGGGIAVLNGTQSRATTQLINCTFYRNGRFVIAKNWSDVYVATDSVGHDLYIDNCIFWEPQANKLQLFTNNNFNNVTMYDYHINNSLVNLTDYVIPGAPESYGPQVIFGIDPKFVNPAIGDFRLQKCSPAVNKGNNAATNNANLIYDLDGSPRIFLDTVDLGAFEVQDSCIIVGDVDLPDIQSLTFGPNPAITGEIIHINISNLSPGRIIWEMFDANARTIETGNSYPITNGGYTITAPDKPGVYFLRIKNSQIIYLIKFIVIR